MLTWLHDKRSICWSFAVSDVYAPQADCLNSPNCRASADILMSVFMALGCSNWCRYANTDCKRTAA